MTWGLGDDGRKKKKRSYSAMELRRKRRKEDAPERGLFDLPPEKDDFDIDDMVNSLKKEALMTPIIPNDDTSAAPKKLIQLDAPKSNEVSTSSLKVEQNAARLLKISVEDKSKEETMKRFEGESKKTFFKRVKQETRQLIRKDMIQTQNPEKETTKEGFHECEEKGEAWQGN